VFSSQGQRLVNLLSAIVVLVGGFYIIIFMPFALSPTVRIIIGVFLILYFLLRLNYYVRHSSERKADPLGRPPKE